MDIQTYVCGACTTASISNLGLERNAERAMLTFCMKVMGKRGGRFGTGGFGPLESFYVYTAGPEESGHGHSKKWVKYGTEFADLIRKEKLGRIVTCGAKLNKKYHPDTTCQTWLWSPIQERLEKWYVDHLPKKGEKITYEQYDLCARCGGYLMSHKDKESKLMCNDGTTGQWRGEFDE